MSVPGELSTGRQPPLAIPLGHFVVGLGFLLAGAVAGLAGEVGLVTGPGRLAHVHLLLAGWVCVTIMGAMTQFVPVWSGVALYSRRLATLQLWLVGLGLAGFAAVLIGGRVGWVPVPGAAMALGFWAFVYNIGRTLPPVGSWGVTERHFAVALACFVLVAALGAVLAAGLGRSVLGSLPVDRSGVVGAHATLAVFGAVLTTVLGALYQLATMFTRTELHGIDHLLRRTEEATYPAGVVALAVGRLLGLDHVATAGAIALLAGLLGFGVVLARKLYEARVDWTPMLSRYAVVAVAVPAWALATVPSWLDDPLGAGVRFGAPGSSHLLFVGVVGFVVTGTLYHVVPFIVWIHRYSDRLGYEDVPMIDDLYSDRIAAADFALLLAGGTVLVGTDLGVLPAASTVAGGALVLAGVGLFVWNMVAVIRDHGPESLGGFGTGAGGPAE